MRSTLKNAGISGERARPRPGPYPATLLGAAALAALTVLGGLGVCLGGPSSAPARMPVAEVATSVVPLDFTDAETQLLNKLPAGYSQSVCTPASDPVPAALAALDCTNNANGGPPITRYSLFGDPTALGNAFQAALNSNDAVNPITPAAACPGGEPSPGGWHYNATPNIQAGSIFCGTFSNGDADLDWTKDADLVLGSARGGNLNDVYQWWSRYA